MSIGATITLIDTGREYHTVRDWGLEFVGQEVPEPQIKKYDIEVPGRRTKINAALALFGYVTYENRTINIDFLLKAGWAEFDEKAHRIEDLLGGQFVKVWMDFSPHLYWTGQVTVRREKSGAFGKLRLILDAEPYQYRRSVPDYEWLWDPFSFVDGYLPGGASIVSNGKVTDMLVPVPAYNCTCKATASADNMYFIVEGKRFRLRKDVAVDILGVIFNSETRVSIEGAGTVDLQFRGQTL